MSQYKVTNEELADFARKIYEEACCGYLDLKDSVCDRMVREFIDGRQIVSGLQPIDPVIAETYSPRVNSEGYAGPENNSSTWTYYTTSNDEFGASIQITSVGNTLQLRDEPNVSPRIEEAVRPDENLRMNYEGNESERF